MKDKEVAELWVSIGKAKAYLKVHKLLVSLSDEVKKLFEAAVEKGMGKMGVKNED